MSAWFNDIFDWLGAAFPSDAAAKKASRSTRNRQRVKRRQRRSIFSLTSSEVRDLTDAFNTLKGNGTYDKFVRRHFKAMSVAHRGSLFLPWHRKFIEEIEDELLAVRPSIQGLPYWPWERNDGRGTLWTDASFGPDGDPDNDYRVLSGPFAHWRALIYNGVTGQIEPRATTGLVRQLGRDPRVSELPASGDVRALYEASEYTVYDVSPWDDSVNTMRNRLEGWVNRPALHNKVHLWIGGDMEAATSPNDPVFWLVHANVDRIWWRWQQRHGIDNFQCPGSPDDPMAFLRGRPSPAEMLDIRKRGYIYNSER